MHKILLNEANDFDKIKTKTRIYSLSRHLSDLS